MKITPEHRLGKFVWGSVSGAIAASLVFTALYFLHCEEAGIAANQMSVGEWVGYVPWFWFFGVSGVFGVINARGRAVDGGALAYLE